ncbi:MAG: protein kinase [Acidobacteria bacterium]|nr:protein kinase [Acidobacteriota bacterium]
MSARALLPGTLLAERYEVLQLLGEGGMGAVYKARDRELDRTVALKVIRPELLGQPKVLQRFKQELVLARQVTHKNVVRVFDLGTASGITFITMEFLEGQSLADLLEKRQFSAVESVRIARQVCRALEAAHGENYIHRDLKPQNIMVSDGGKATVMDFGLARSVEMGGMTQSNTLLGTPTYMSPEQAKGLTLDARSDLFALGIILYEMLTGKIPFQADTILATLLKRTQEPPVPPTQLNPEISPGLNDIVMKCLTIDPEQRYQTATELLYALETQSGVPSDSPMTVSMPIPVAAAPDPALLHARAASRRRKWIAAGLSVLLLAVVGGMALRNRFLMNAEQPKPVTVLVADLENNTGDPVFDDTLESMFIIAMEGASFINAYNRGQARQISRQLRSDAAKMDETLARLVAVREGIEVVIGGSITRQGEGYRVWVEAVDAASGKPITSGEATADKREAVLAAVPKLAAPIRRALGDATPESTQIAAAETYSASSLEVMHLYAVAQEEMWAGKRSEAIRDYSEAVRLDPNFGRAYAGLAVAHVNLKKYAEAGEYYKKVLALLDRMTEREQLRTMGTYYLAYVNNNEQAIETLRKLVSRYPADTAGYNNLGIAYAWVRNLPAAMSASQRALEISPTNVQNRYNFAQYSMLAGNFDTAISESERILKQNPNYEYAYLSLALSTLAKGDVKGAREIYSRLAQVSPQGVALGKSGEADLEMYLGRYKEALEALQSGMQADLKENNTGELAVKYVASAEAYLALGQGGPAIEAASKAVELSPVESILYLAARILLAAGEEAKARELARRLENLLQPQSKSYARLIAGEIALQHQRTAEAVEAFQDGEKLLDSWISHFLLGKAYTEAAHYAEAWAEFDLCWKRSGEAADLFVADMATLRYLPPLYYWSGRAREGLGTKEAANNSYQVFLKLRTDADPADPLVADAKRRSAAGQ